MNALDAVGLASAIEMADHEIRHGTSSAKQLADRDMQDNRTDGVEACIDARSVFDAVVAEVVKTPSDKTMLIHALTLKEAMNAGKVSKLHWVDTDDMVTDGLTKGKVLRDAILEFTTQGHWTLRKNAVSWPKE